MAVDQSTKITTKTLAATIAKASGLSSATRLNQRGRLRTERLAGEGACSEPSSPAVFDPPAFATPAYWVAALRKRASIRLGTSTSLVRMPAFLADAITSAAVWVVKSPVRCWAFSASE